MTQIRYLTRWFKNKPAKARNTWALSGKVQEDNPEDVKSPLEQLVINFMITNSELRREESNLEKELEKLERKYPILLSMKEKLQEKDSTLGLNMDGENPPFNEYKQIRLKLTKIHSDIRDLSSVFTIKAYLLIGL